LSIAILQEEQPNMQKSGEGRAKKRLLSKMAALPAQERFGAKENSQ